MGRALWLLRRYAVPLTGAALVMYLTVAVVLPESEAGAMLLVLMSLYVIYLTVMEVLAVLEETPRRGGEVYIEVTLRNWPERESRQENKQR
jgi:hypothetical protein